MTLDLRGIEAQARDISFLIDFAGTLPNADTSAIAAAGFSWGGISNVFAAARDARIRALICLDGSLRSSPGLAGKAGDVHPERMTIPLLSIAQGQWTPEDQDRWWSLHPDHAGPSVLNAWTHGDLVAVYMLGLSHMEHSAMYQRNEDTWHNVLHLYHQKKADYGRADGIIGYAWIARYALQFVNAYLKRDATAMTFLQTEPSRNGAPRHFIAWSYRAGTDRDETT
jgi:pimeloyl-ACP methyl ester carboxylesterase